MAKNSLIACFYAQCANPHSRRTHQRPRRPGRIRHLHTLSCPDEKQNYPFHQPPLQYRAARRPHLCDRARAYSRKWLTRRTHDPQWTLRRAVSTTSRRLSLNPLIASHDNTVGTRLYRVRDLSICAHRFVHNKVFHLFPVQEANVDKSRTRYNRVPTILSCETKSLSEAYYTYPICFV